MLEILSPERMPSLDTLERIEGEDLDGNKGILRERSYFVTFINGVAMSVCQTNIQGTEVEFCQTWFEITS